jgi:hypothetical protein
MFGESDASLFEINIYFMKSYNRNNIDLFHFWGLSYYVSKLSRTKIIKKNRKLFINHILILYE